MKKLIILIFILVSTITFAQALKFKAYSYSIRYFDTNKWTEWKDFEDTDILLSINTDDNKIKIYSKAAQIYDIIQYYDSEKDKEGNETIRMYSEDQDGTNCNVDFVKHHKGVLHLYVRYNNIQWMYEIESLD